MCLLRLEGQVVGASSAYVTEVGPLGGRRLWVYRSLLDPIVAGQAPEMVRATFAALEAEFDGAPGSPLGLCVLLADPAEQRRRPQLQWSDPPAIYAGYLPDGRGLWVAYFRDALIERPLTPPTSAPAVPPPGGSLLPSGYRVEPFAEQTRVGGQDVTDLWAREGVLGPEEAKRRLAEVLLVATDPQDQLAGVSTAYLQRNEQLRAELWYARVFVAAAHRRSGLAIAIAHAARDHLVERYRSGTDRRGIGILFEVESEILKRFLPQAVWPRTQFAFIGENARGSHVRVYYFPGALAPPFA